MAIPSRAAPRWAYRRERLPGGHTVESGSPVAEPRVSGGWTSGSDLLSGPRGRISGGWTEAVGANLRWFDPGADLVSMLIFI